jgi:hypothetical protein
LDNSGVDAIPVAQTETFEMFRQAMAQFHKAAAASDKNILLKNMKI